MKKHYALVSLFCLPLYAIAQPVINNAEKHIIGTTIKHVQCDAAAPGPAGINQTWNFSGLNPSGDTTYGIIKAPPTTNNPFPGADFMVDDNDSTYSYYDTSVTKVELMGYVDSTTSGGVFSYSNHMFVIKDPVTYGDTATDSFYNSGNFGGFPIDGAGFLTMEADAYGTLQLPMSTYTNVLRIKTISTEHDTIQGFGAIDVNIRSYIWYKNGTLAPLLRIDSFDITGVFTSSEVDVQYFHSAGPTAVKGMPASEKMNATAYLGNNELLLTGSFENGKQYQVSVYNVNGQKVFSNDFTANGQRAQFATADISNGTYIVSIRRKGDMSSITAFKIVKQ